MLRRIIHAGSALAAVVTGGSVFAHPGHGVIPSDQPAHWLEPLHFVPLALAGSAVAIAVWRLRARRDDR
jgi:hypothetical protein